MITNDPPSTELADRILRLERSNRRLFGIVLLLMVAAFVQTFWHFLPMPGTVVAQRFVLKPPGQPVRSEWSVWADGTPCLRFNNDTGEARAFFALFRDGNLSLRLSDSSFTNRLEMKVGSDGAPRIALFGKDGLSHADLWLDAANQGHLDYR